MLRFLIICSCLSALLGCIKSFPPRLVETRSGLKLYLVERDGVFDARGCADTKLGNQVIMIKSANCRACIRNQPGFLGACTARGVKPVILDISNDRDRLTMYRYGVTVKYTPTVLSGCKFLVGEKSKSIYYRFLENEMRR